MIALYERLTRACQTINQINRVHIALENWMTPQQWFRLRSEMLQSPGYEFLHQPAAPRPLSAGDVRHAQQRWLASLHGMYGKAPFAAAQAFVRHRIRRHITWYKAADSGPRGKTLAVCFTGMAQRMMAPLPAFLQHIDAGKTDVVLIRYPRGKGFRYGLEGVAGSFEQTVAALAGILPAGEYARRVAIGVSGGGLPAVLTALQLDFDAALSFGTGHPDDARWNEALGYSGVRLVERFRQRAVRKLPLFLVFGSDAQADAEAARALAQLLPARLVKVGDEAKAVGHAALHPLLMSGNLHRFLAETVFAPGTLVPPLPQHRPPAAKSEALFKTSLAPLTGPRYFGIGFNKTGTTSLGRCFEALGLTPVAEPRSPHIDFRQLCRAIFERGDFQPALEAAGHFRSFQDRPWNVWDIYRRLDEKFEGSYFILTERDPEKWWNSVEKWLTVTHGNDRAKHLRYLHHLKVDRLEKGRFVDAYQRYNDGVKRYFAGRGNLLVMNLEAGDGWDTLCPFLGLPVPDVDFPHANRQRAITPSRA